MPPAMAGFNHDGGAPWPSACLRFCSLAGMPILAESAIAIRLSGWYAATALQRFSNQAGQWRRWAGTRLTKKAMALIDGHIENEFSGNEPGHVPAMNLWQFYNVVTWYITHHAASLNHRVDMEGRLRVAMKDF